MNIFCFRLVTHRKDQRNDVIHPKDQRNDVIKTLPSESEASDVFTPCERTDRKFSLSKEKILQ